MRYNAFISYSHAADGKLAPALQRALQRLAKPWYRRRALEVFRDETGLAVDPNLWGAIVRALDDSEWFLLLTSPQAADSVWVNREIDHWKAHRPLDRMLPVLTDGHWEWDPKAGDFTADSDAVAPSLRGVFTDEPRHLDLRWAHDVEQLDLRNSRFRDAVAEVAAPLHGRTKDEIEGDDVRQHRRTVRIAWSAAASLVVLTVAAVAGAGIAVYNANRAEQRQIQAEAQRLAAQSRTELERPDLAFLLAAHGYRMHQNIQTEGALLTAVATLPEFKRRISTDSPVTAVATSDAADRVWIGTSAGDVIAHRFSDGEEVGRADGLFAREVVAMAPAKAGAGALVATDGTVVTTLDGVLKPRVVRTPNDVVHALAVEPSTGRVAAGTSAGDVLVWEQDGQVPTSTFRVVPDDSDGAFPWITALAWTPDGALVIAGRDGLIRRVNLDATDRPVWQQAKATGQTGWVSALAVLDDGTVVSGGSDGAVGFWSGTDGKATAAGLNRVHADEVVGLAPTGDHPQSGSVASVSEDGSVIYWDHLTGHPPLPPIRVDEQGGTAVAWDPANVWHGVVGGSAGGALLLDYGADQRRPIARPLPGWKDAAAVAISPTEDRLAVATVTARTAQGDAQLVSELTVTDAAQPRPDGPSVRIPGGVDRVVFTPDGESILASTTDGTVAVWDGVADDATVTQVGTSGIPPDLAVSPDGVTVATRSMDSVSDDRVSAPARLWRLENGRLVEHGRVDGPVFSFGLAFTPDGSRLVMGGINEVVVHRLDDGQRVTVDLADDQSRSLAISPDGATIAVGLWSGPVRLLDVESGEPIGDEMRVAARVTDIAFRDSSELVTASEDGSIIFWDIGTRTRVSDKPLTAVDSDAGAGYAKAISLAVGRDMAVTASVADGQVVTWSFDPVDWIAEGCEVHRRELSDAEKRRYGLEEAAPILLGLTATS